MSLSDPTKKMSKSDENQRSYISILDDDNVIRNKIKSAVTDLDTKVKYDPDNKPGISNLLNIVSAITGESIKDLELKYQDYNYEKYKLEVADVVINELKPIKERYNYYIGSQELDEILDNGALRANMVANRKMAKVCQRLGLGRKKK